MIESLNNFKKGNWKDVDEKVLYPLLRMASSNIINLKKTGLINKYIFFIPPKICKGLMQLNLDWKYVYYPKAEEDKLPKVDEMVKEVLCKYYNWSNREYEANRKLIQRLTESESFRKEISLLAGLTEKENKSLGIKIENKKGILDYGM